MQNSEIDLESYLEKLKSKNVDVSEVESYLEKLISSNASKQPPEAQ